MKNQIVTTVLALVILGSATAGYLAGVANQRPTTSVSTSIITGPTTTVTSVTTYAYLKTYTFVAPANGQLGAWNRTTSYPLPSETLACVASSGYVYCVGGFAGSTPSNGLVTNQSYYTTLSSTGVGSWTRTTDYPIHVQDQSCVTSSSYVYCVGGRASPRGAFIADVYYASLSPSGLGPWTHSTPYPYPISPKCMADSSRIYCVAAHWNGTGFTSAADAYFADLSPSGVGPWTESSSLPANTAGCSASVGYAYCFGGGPCLPPHDCSSPTYYASLSTGGISGWNRTSDLPTAGYANFVVADSYVYYMSIPVYFALVSSDGAGVWQTTTNLPPSTSAASCVSSGLYIYCVTSTWSQSYDNVYYTKIGSSNPAALHQQNPPPFQHPVYLVPAATSPTTGCSVSMNGRFAGAPCFSRDINEAVIFQCESAAATPSGCKTTVVSPANSSYDYNATIWYPYTNLSSTNANCAFQPSLGYTSPFQVWCISIGGNSFIVSEPG